MRSPSRHPSRRSPSRMGRGSFPRAWRRRKCETETPQNLAASFALITHCRAKGSGKAASIACGSFLMSDGVPENRNAAQRGALIFRTIFLGGIITPRPCQVLSPANAGIAVTDLTKLTKLTTLTTLRWTVLPKYCLCIVGSSLGRVEPSHVAGPESTGLAGAAWEI